MTLPYERVSAVLSARNFLYALIDPKQTPRVPRAVRQRAVQVLRHYPGHLDFDDVQASFGGVPQTRKVKP